MGGSPERTKYPPTTITYMPTHIQMLLYREEHRKSRVLEKWRGGSKQRTNLPIAVKEIAGEGEMDDAGAVV